MPVTFLDPLYFYVLRKPDGEPVYVGRTFFPETRMAGHRCRYAANRRLAAVITELRGRGEVLRMETLEVRTAQTAETVCDAERRWIRHFIAQGYDLCNVKQRQPRRARKAVST